MSKRVAIVTNTPPPYRVPAWDMLATKHHYDVHLVFCTEPHIDTSIKLQEKSFTSHFLGGRYIPMEKRFFHASTDIWPVLRAIDPDVVITTGFIPTYLLAFAWSVLHRRVHIAMTDGTDVSEKGLTVLHRLARRLVFTFSKAFIGASEGSLRLFRQYKLPESKLFKAVLCTTNAPYLESSIQPQVDLIYCGRYVAHKNPAFALDVAHRISELLGRVVSIDFVGAGPEEQRLRTRASQLTSTVRTNFLGYASQSELPSRYRNAKIFLFPTSFDPWGVVVNEACAAGLAILTSPEAGVAGELVVAGVNGHVIGLDANEWARAAAQLLNDQKLLESYAEASRKLVQNYTFEHAAEGMARAIAMSA